MPLQTKRFRIVNEGFVCARCGKDVPPTSTTTPRNHCPHCLWSIHVDINPGDRANPCEGLMRPIGIYTHTKKGYVILHQCVKCGVRIKAMTITTDKNAADNFDRVVELADRAIFEGKRSDVNVKFYRGARKQSQERKSPTTRSRRGQ